jgi:hypothetical protein
MARDRDTAEGPGSPPKSDLVRAVEARMGREVTPQEAVLIMALVGIVSEHFARVTPEVQSP